MAQADKGNEKKGESGQAVVEKWNGFCWLNDIVVDHGTDFRVLIGLPAYNIEYVNITQRCGRRVLSVKVSRRLWVCIYLSKCCFRIAGLCLLFISVTLLSSLSLCTLISESSSETKGKEIGQSERRTLFWWEFHVEWMGKLLKTPCRRVWELENRSNKVYNNEKATKGVGTRLYWD